MKVKIEIEIDVSLKEFQDCYSGYNWDEEDVPKWVSEDAVENCTGSLDAWFTRIGFSGKILNAKASPNIPKHLVKGFSGQAQSPTVEKVDDEVQQFKDALRHPKFCYTRARNPSRMNGTWSTTDDLIVFVYCIDETGVKRSHAGLPYKEAIPLIDEYNKAFPLSPTEGLGSY